MTKIVLLNGPAGSGKDTFANALCNLVNTRGEVVKFASPLKTVAMHLYCNGDSKKFYEFDHDQVKKVTPDDVFLGKTCRQVQIDISEQYMKPMHGQNVFGKLLAETIAQKAESGVEAFYVSDSGFRPEAETLVDKFGAEDVLLVRIHRDSCPVNENGSFPKDSRGYINLDDLGVKSIDLVNVDDNINVGLGELVKQVTSFMKA